jgi:hypothetical protein
MDRGYEAMNKAIAFTERHGFKSYRFGIGVAIGSKRELRDVHIGVNTWAFKGASVEFDEAAGTITVTPSESDGRRAFIYHGRKSK